MQSGLTLAVASAYSTRHPPIKEPNGGQKKSDTFPCVDGAIVAPLTDRSQSAVTGLTSPRATPRLTRHITGQWQLVGAHPGSSHNPQWPVCISALKTPLHRLQCCELCRLDSGCKHLLRLLPSDVWREGNITENQNIISKVA